MCGRFVRHSDVHEFTALVAGLTYSGPDPKERYNVAPSQLCLVARENHGSGQRECVSLKWGLVPHWSKDAKVGYKLINARSETAATKPSFRDGMRSRRCLVAADGWYEWRVTPEGKIPTLIQRVGAGGEIVPFYFAGLWASWKPKDQPDAEWLETFTILTRAACPELMEIHDRMPVVLLPDSYDAWLDHRAPGGADAMAVLQSAALEGFTHRPVSTRVNRPKNGVAECMAINPA